MSGLHFRWVWVAAIWALVVGCLAAETGSAGGTSAESAGSRGVDGYLAVHGERVLAVENAEGLFTPASVTKLVVVAAALHHLGPDYRVTTSVRGSVEPRAGRLAGDLVVEAAGDPTWSERFFDDPRAPLRDLARQLRQRGVERVDGDLVVDVSRFPGRSHPPSRPLAEMAYGYGAPTSGLAIDENAVQVEIAPGRRVGDPGTARRLGSREQIAGGPKIVGRIRTVSKDRHGKGTVDFQPVWESSTIVVRGEYPISEPSYRIQLSVPDGNRYAGEVLAAVLRAAGMEILGEVRVVAERPPSGPVLAELDSPPLSEWLQPILSRSVNWQAEMLLRVLAAEVGGAGRIDEGLDLERQFLEQEVGLAPESFDLDDGSGLSPYNLLSPEAVVALLRYAWRQPWRQTFVGALAIPGEGTLEVWRRLPPLAAKTGRIRNTMALAGYLDPDPSSEAEPAIFACFLNHRPGDRGGLRAEIAELARRWWRLSKASG